MSKTLVIPDPHADPDHDPARFGWLGNLIIDQRPDPIICLGDMGNMNSLSSYDKGKHCFEGRRYFKDCQAVVEAQELLYAPLTAFNDRAKRNRERQYKPRRVMILGNHDDGRIHKVTQANPELIGTVDLDGLQYHRFWSEVVRFKDTIEIDGVSYSHYFPSGVMGNPISGEHIGRRLILKNHKSSICGHSHILDMHNAVRSDGSRIWGVSAGCFMDFTPDYAQGQGRLWWRGVLLLNDVNDGDFDPELISMDRLKREYS